MPYPLPAGGPPYSEDLRWFLVAVPDDVAFVRAAMGAYTELTKYWMWGHEGKEPGRDQAAQVWEGAIAATLEALEMGFPDILLGHIDDVETLLQSLLDKSACCPATGIEDVVTDWQDIVGDEIDTSGSEVVVGVGDPPTGAADWTQFQSKLCDGASKYADGLIAMVDNFAMIQGLLSGLTLATLGAFIASFLPILGVSVVAAGVVVTALGLLGKLDELQDLVEPVSGWDEMRTALSDARQDIICAIITADTAAEAAENVEAVIEGIDPNIWAWIRFFTIPTVVIQRIFNMESSAAGGYGAGCGTCDPIPDHDYVLVYDQRTGATDPLWNVSGDSIDCKATYGVRINSMSSRSNASGHGWTNSPNRSAMASYGGFSDSSFAHYAIVRSDILFEVAAEYYSTWWGTSVLELRIVGEIGTSQTINLKPYISGPGETRVIVDDDTTLIHLHQTNSNPVSIHETSGTTKTTATCAQTVTVKSVTLYIRDVT